MELEHEQKYKLVLYLIITTGSDPDEKKEATPNRNIEKG